MKILSWDMGSANTAWALNEDGIPIDSGKFKNTINDLTINQFNGQKSKFLKEYKKLIQPLKKGDFIVAERFQTRFRSVQVEQVSWMLGMMAASSHVPFYGVIASQWKNYVNRLVGKKVDAETLLVDKKGKQIYGEHVADALLIGCWFYEHETEKESKFLRKFVKRYCD